MPIHHLTLAVRGRRALARTEAERRTLVRALARVGGDRLLLFCLVDDHLHACLRAARARQLADCLRRVLVSSRPDLELKPPHLEPVGTRAYLRSLVDYLLTQPERHGLGVPSALWTGSCFQDLVGARLLPGFSASPLRDELPRLRLQPLFAKLGLGFEPLLPADDEDLARAGPARLVELAAGVHLVGPSLQGRSAPVVAARALAVQAATRAGLPRSSLVRFLDVAARSLHRLTKRDVTPRAVSALRLRLALEERVRARTQLPSTSVSRRLASG